MVNITFEQVAELPYTRENRATKLSDGNMYMVATSANIAWIAFAKSTDKGDSWISLPRITTPQSGFVIMNPFLFEDENHIIHFVYNQRPLDFNVSRKHSIWYMRADSLDFNWSAPVKIYECGNDEGTIEQSVIRSGCYEPSVASLGNNKVAIFFANECNLYATHTQSIDAIICNTSIAPSEPGAFSDAFTVACAWGYRDGMPIAKNINDEIVCVIEDNSGYNGYATHLSTLLFWDKSLNRIITRNDPGRRMVQPLDNLVYGGQPYFDTNSRGETLVINGGTHSSTDGVFNLYYSKASFEDFELIKTFTQSNCRIGYGAFVQFINDDEFLCGYNILLQGSSDWDSPTYRGTINNNNNI